MAVHRTTQPVEPYRLDVRHLGKDYTVFVPPDGRWITVAGPYRGHPDRYTIAELRESSAPGVPNVGFYRAILAAVESTGVEYAPTIGDRIAAARQHADLSQAEVADRAGVTQSEVSLWETGKREPGVSSLVRLADALEVTVDALLREPG